MSDETSLTVIDQREVTFYGDELVAIKAADGNIYVALRQMCMALGIDPRSQLRRIRDHDILQERLEVAKLLTGARSIPFSWPKSLFGGKF